MRCSSNLVRVSKPQVVVLKLVLLLGTWTFEPITPSGWCFYPHIWQGDFIHSTMPQCSWEDSVWENWGNKRGMLVPGECHITENGTDFIHTIYKSLLVSYVFICTFNLCWMLLNKYPWVPDLACDAKAKAISHLCWWHTRTCLLTAKWSAHCINSADGGLRVGKI